MRLDAVGAPASTGGSAYLGINLAQLHLVIGLGPGMVQWHL